VFSWWLLRKLPPYISSPAYLYLEQSSLDSTLLYIYTKIREWQIKAGLL
jgi:hypothetical protein